MKRAPLFLFGLVLLAGLAWAIVPVSVQPDRWMFKGGLCIGATCTSTNVVTNTKAGSATIDFASTVAGRVFSSSVTTTGAVAGDVCVVGVPTAAAALKAEFGCYVDATDSTKVWFSPDDTKVGTATFDGGSPAQIDVTVSAGSICTCSPVGTTAEIADGGCAVSVTSTTLTLTGPDGSGTTVNYNCAAPVDPASGTFRTRTFSVQ